MEDNYKHKGLRRKLTDKIKQKGIQDEAVLAAINHIPRHLFLDSGFLEYAYQDKPFPIGSGQTISQPYTVAFQTELLTIKKGDKVLEIGTGSGYQACVLAELGAKVFSVERQKKLYEKTKAILPKLGYHTIKCFYGDGNKGVPAFAPYDKILITAAAPELSEALISQLKPGGLLVVPFGTGEVQQMIRLRKNEEGEMEQEEFGSFKFVPMLKNKADD